MADLRIVSGGAAQGLVGALVPEFTARSGLGIDGTFGAVGAMRARLREGDPADLVILTGALIEQLAGEGLVVAGSAADVGIVETAVAVRAGDPRPADITGADGLAAALERADALYIPDPEQATAGIHVAKVLRRLGLWDRMAGRLRPFPNGAAAMRELASSRAARPIGCTQVTEILITPGVALVGPLPPGLELRTVYAAAIGARAAHPEAARGLLAMLTAEDRHEQRRAAGFSA